MNIWTLLSLGLLGLSSTQAAVSSENFLGCGGNSLSPCRDVLCPDGGLAPAGQLELCPPDLLSEDKLGREVPALASPPSNCSAIGCLVELCTDGSVPPTPPGRCCPSALLCPRDCRTAGDCRLYHCRDGSLAPTPPGSCCPDPRLCLDSLSLTCSREECDGPGLCPNGDLAPTAPGHCCPDPGLCPMADCDTSLCLPEECEDGSLAPIPRAECCPRASQCSLTDCGQVRCLLERCSDGSVAPTPPGRCCPSQAQCRTRQISSPQLQLAQQQQEEQEDEEEEEEKGIDCEGKQCISVLCQDGSLAPVPPGTCCPNQALCLPPPPPPRTPSPSPRGPPGPGADCGDVACFKIVCPDGSPAPVPPGQCCPDTAQCLEFSVRGDWER